MSHNFGRETKIREVTASKVRLTFAFIVLLTIFSSLVALPNIPNWVPAHNWFNSFGVKLGLDLQGGTHLVYQADVKDVAAGERADRVDALRDVIERRINVYGVSEPVVQTNTSGDNYRIIVELAGITDVNEAISIIDKTPLLEFKTEGEPIDNPEQDTSDEQKNIANDLLQRVKSGEDFATLAKQYSEDPGSAAEGGELPWVKRGIFVPEFDEAIFDTLKKGEVTDQLVESQFGYHIIKKLDERITDQGEQEVLSTHILIKKADADFISTNWLSTGLDGKYIEKAQLSFDQRTQEPLVLLNFNSEGKDIFSKITGENVGKPLAIFLDGSLRSAPIVQQQISDGSAQISGNFTVAEAKQLVKDLNLGALPTPISLISQQTVGATLGDLSVSQSLLAGIIGLIAAAIFMLIFYRLPGLLAVAALLIYSALTFAIFVSIPVTMTLAGVAGFILSIGMAVDANILIFERTKEELRDGQSLKAAIENGFYRAWTSIRDSNISSLITTAILAWFGTSIIKGFAITLAIGILVSMFSAITVTRTLLRLIFTKRLENKYYLFGAKKAQS